VNLYPSPKSQCH